jgi:hypothetical protein
MPTHTIMSKRNPNLIVVQKPHNRDIHTAHHWTGIHNIYIYTYVQAHTHTHTHGACHPLPQDTPAWFGCCIISKSEGTSALDVARAHGVLKWPGGQGFCRRLTRLLLMHMHCASCCRVFFGSLWRCGEVLLGCGQLLALALRCWCCDQLLARCYV